MIKDDDVQLAMINLGCSGLRMQFFYFFLTMGIRTKYKTSATWCRSSYPNTVLPKKNKNKEEIIQTKRTFISMKKSPKLEL